MTATAQRTSRGSERLLVGATAFFADAVLVHNFDHVRRGADAVSADVYLAGTAAIVLEVAVVVLCMRRDRRAPALAAFAGLSLAVGYLVVHFTPRRAWLSDSLLLEGTSPLSIVAAVLEVAAALTLGLAGVALVRERSAASLTPRPMGRAVWHPVSLVMIAGNVVVIAASVAQRG